MVSIKKINKKAFSLIEISIVLLIIGIIIGGTIKSSALYTKYRVSTAQNLTKGSPVNNIPDLLVWYETTLETSFKEQEAQNYNDLESAETALGIGLIQTWYDNNPNGLTRVNATQSTLGYRPQYHLDCINNLPCLKFDGTDDLLDIATTLENDILDYREYSIFIVDQKDSSGTAPYFLFGPDSKTSAENEAVAVGYNSSDKIHYSHGSATNYYIIDPSMVDDSDKVVLQSFIGAFDNTLLSTYISHRMYDASSASTLVDAGTSAFTKLNGGFNYTIGAGYNEATATYYKGNIGEVIIFKRALKADERKSVETYLMDKWKINNGS